MKITRLKHARRHLLWYKMNFGIHAPYKVLLDGNFVHVAVEQKIMIEEMLIKMLGRCRLYVTGCIVAELDTLGPAFYGTAGLANSFRRIRCGHDDDPVSASQCLRSLFGTTNPKGFCLATQDEELKEVLRRVPGIPLFHINYNLITLEQPTRVERRAQKANERLKSLPSAAELRAMETASGEAAKKPRRKRAKGPNPLSIKKGKKKAKKGKADSKGKKHKRSNKSAQATGGGPPTSVDGEGGAKKRKRRRKKRKASQAGSGDGNDQVPSSKRQKV